VDRNLRVSLKGVLLLASLAGLTFALKGLGVGELFDKGWIESHVIGTGAYSWALFVGFVALTTGVGIPRQIVCFLGGSAFGFLEGTLLCSLGTLLGCALAFYYSRFLGQEFVLRRFKKRLLKVNAFLVKNPFTATLLLRLIPVASNGITNLLAGVSQAPAGWFFLGSLVGHLPMTMIFTLLGSGVRVDPFWRTALSAALFVGMSVLGWRLFKRYRLQEVSDDEEPLG
jgi:uncharacterized membrane protein YdjX (TVP38/TMEM64 family)